MARLDKPAHTCLVLCMLCTMGQSADYYPLQAGYAWEYTGEYTSHGYHVTSTITDAVHGDTVVDGVQLKRILNETVSNYEPLDPGDSGYQLIYSIYYYLYEKGNDIYTAGFIYPDTSEAEKDGQHTYTEGDRWDPGDRDTIVVVYRGSVETKSGIFDSCFAQVMLSGDTYIYAPDVGLVIAYTDTDTLIELTRYWTDWKMASVRPVPYGGAAGSPYDLVDAGAIGNAYYNARGQKINAVRSHGGAAASSVLLRPRVRHMPQIRTLLK